MVCSSSSCAHFRWFIKDCCAQLMIPSPLRGGFQSFSEVTDIFYWHPFTYICFAEEAPLTSETWCGYGSDQWKKHRTEKKLSTCIAEFLHVTVRFPCPGWISAIPFLCEVLNGPIDQTGARTCICDECDREHNGIVEVWVESGDDGEPPHSLGGLFLKEGWFNSCLHSENASAQSTAVKCWRYVRWERCALLCQGQVCLSRLPPRSDCQSSVFQSEDETKQILPSVNISPHKHPDTVALVYTGLLVARTWPHFQRPSRWLKVVMKNDTSDFRPSWYRLVLESPSTW